MDAGDRKSRSQPDSRTEFMEKLCSSQTFKKLFPSRPKTKQERMTFVIWMEETVCSASSSRDKNRKIIHESILALYDMNEGLGPNSLASGYADSCASSDSGAFLGTQTKVQSLGKSLQTTVSANRSQKRQLLAPGNIWNILSATRDENSALHIVSGVRYVLTSDIFQLNQNVQNMQNFRQRNLPNAIMQPNVQQQPLHAIHGYALPVARQQRRKQMTKQPPLLSEKQRKVRGQLRPDTAVRIEAIQLIEQKNVVPDMKMHQQRLSRQQNKAKVLTMQPSRSENSLFGLPWLQHLQLMYQSQTVASETLSTSTDSRTQTGLANGGDWRDQSCQKAMKETYLHRLNRMKLHLSAVVQKINSLHQFKTEQLEKLRKCKTTSERQITFSVSPKDHPSHHLEKLAFIGEQFVISFLKMYGLRNYVQPTREPPQQQTRQDQASGNRMTPPSQATNSEGSAAAFQEESTSAAQQNAEDTSQQSTGVRTRSMTHRMQGTLPGAAPAAASNEASGLRTDHPTQADHDVTGRQIRSVGRRLRSLKDIYAELDKKKVQTEASISDVLLEQITEINQQLVDTVLSIHEEDADPPAAAAAIRGTIVRCTFRASTPQQQTLKLLVPTDYPRTSPEILDTLRDEDSEENKEIYTMARQKLEKELRGLDRPNKIFDIARSWDINVRDVTNANAVPH